MTSGIGGASAANVLSELGPWADRAAAIGGQERGARIEKARRLMKDVGADALMIGAGASLRYFAGIGWGASERLVAMLLPANGAPILICQVFEQGSLEAELTIEVRLRSGRRMKALRLWSRRRCVKPGPPRSRSIRPWLLS